MRKLICLLVCTLLLVTSSVFAITPTISGNVVTLTTLDGDWLWTTTFTEGSYPYEYANGILVKSITFYPSAADDVLALEEGSTSGPGIFPVKAIDAYDVKHFPVGGVRMKPVFDYSDSTIGAAADAKIVIILDGR